MQPDKVEYYSKHSEHEDEPARRSDLEFEDSQYAIVLSNDEGLPLLHNSSELTGKQFQMSSSKEDVMELPIKTLEVDNAVPTKQKSWRLHYDNGKLLIPCKKSKMKHTWPHLGNVITGKEFILNHKIKSAKVSPKNTPTPFHADIWGDTYNDSYYSEPRIVETIPSTVFNAVNDIMNFGKTAFQKKDFEAAATKYRKAFHYCHSYYPDDLNDTDLSTATRLKMQSLSNLALAGIKCKSAERLSQAVESCDFVLEMPEATERDKAKSYYRRGQALLEQGDDQMALHDFQKSLSLIDDPATHQAIELCALARDRRETSLRAKLKHAFT